jgi:hypothetical protein
MWTVPGGASFNQIEHIQINKHFSAYTRIFEEIRFDVPALN